MTLLERNAKSLIRIMSTQNIQAINTIRTSEPGLCINFVELNPETLVMMVSFMKDGVKTADTLNTKEFSQSMCCLENQLSKVDSWYEEYCKEHDLSDYDDHPEYFRTWFDLRLSRKFLRIRKCHRLFFMPYFSLGRVCSAIFNQDTYDELEDCGIYEVYGVLQFGDKPFRKRHDVIEGDLNT